MLRAKKRIGGIFFVGCLFSIAAHAGAQTSVTFYEDILACSQCDSFFTVEAMGAQVENGEVLVLDRVTEQFQSFRVETTFSNGQDLFGERVVFPIATPAPVVVEIQNAFDIYGEILQAYAQGISLDQLNLPPALNGIDSALDVVGDPLMQRNMENAISDFLSGQVVTGFVSAARTILDRLVGNFPGATVVTFPDGSTMKFTHVAIQLINESEILLVVKTAENASRDAQGNAIPTEESEVVNLSISSPDPSFIENWVNLMQRLGIPVQNRTPLGGSSGGNCDSSSTMECGIRLDDEGQPQRFCEITLQDC